MLNFYHPKQLLKRTIQLMIIPYMVNQLSRILYRIKQGTISRNIIYLSCTITTTKTRYIIMSANNYLKFHFLRQSQAKNQFITSTIHYTVRYLYTCLKANWLSIPLIQEVNLFPFPQENPRSDLGQARCTLWLKKCVPI